MLASQTYLQVGQVLSVILFSDAQKTRFLSSPDRVTKALEGTDISLKWTFSVSSVPPYGTKVFEFLFGEWDKLGYVSEKLLVVESNGSVLKRKNFTTKLDWSGDISNCTCTGRVVIHNLTRGDEKNYGVHIEMGLHRTPLTDWLHLIVLVRARIVDFLKRITVKEGNNTTITCRADGNPPPLVEIQRNNKTVTNGTGVGKVRYHIRDIQEEDGGDYVCIASNKVMNHRDQRSVYIEVRPQPGKPTVQQPHDESGHLSENIKLIVGTAGAIGAIMIVITIALLWYKLKQRQRIVHVKLVNERL